MNTSNANSKRLCRKCGEKIPNYVKINGVSKNLCNRKFCLDCSPWGKHNTSPNDPVIRKQRNKKQRNEKYVTTLYKRALERKTFLIEQKGGKCQICGYNKSRNALTFHHRDPSDKCFGLSLNFLWSANWDKIQKEADKCDLLCCNCHAEIESQKSDMVKKVNKKYGTFF
jgi:hypothetical protein